MKHYKNPENNQLFAYEKDGSQDHIIPASFILITDEEAETLCVEAAGKAFDALTYAQKRAAKYPSITDYLDGVVKGNQEQVQAYIDACLAVKAKYPKGAN